MELKATVLADNNGAEGTTEWGLSILIEYRGRKILLDVGASGLFLENAARLGLTLEDVDYAVLSHAHYDHSDGMEPFFAHTKAKFYLRQGCGEDCYKREGLFRFRYLGLPRGILARYPDRFVMAGGDCSPSPGVTLVPHKTPGLSAVGKAERMYRKVPLGYRYDDFAHEQSLVFETEGGLVVFNSCCHGGADVIVREVEATFPGKKVRALIGGLHLFNKSEDQVRSFARRVKATGLQALYTGHCTGKTAYDILAEELGEAVRPLSVGLVMTF